MKETMKEVQGVLSSDPKSVIPHRDPFLWVHRLISKNAECTEGIVELDVPASLEVFKGHFPGNPVFPGVLQVEAAAQACGWIFLSERKHEGPHEVLFVAIDEFKFKKPVLPNSILWMEVQQEKSMRGLHLWNVKIFEKQTKALVGSGTLWLMIKGSQS